MIKYFGLQLKRVLRVVPLMFAATAILAVCFLAIFSELIAIYAKSPDNQKSHFALCGDIEGTYLEVGLEAIQSFDSTRFTLEFEMMEQEEAIELLEAGKSSACIVIPENFAHEIYYNGRILPITYITSGDSVGMTPFLKDEITDIISDALTYGMKSIYGSADAAVGEGISDEAGNIMYEMSIDYIECTVNRTDVYKVEELGIGNSQSLGGYMFCGISVVLLMLISLPFAILFIRRDYALQRIFASKGKSAAKQILAEYGAFFVGIFLLFAAFSLCIALAKMFTSLPIDAVISADSGFGAFMLSIPAVLMLCGFSYMIFEISKDLISGVLSLFFATVFLGYAGGCLYPTFIFPETMQKIVAWLPTGVARMQISSALSGDGALLTTLISLGYTLVFFGISVFVRNRRLKANGG